MPAAPGRGPGPLLLDAHLDELEADVVLIVRAYGEDGIRITIGEEESLAPVVRVAVTLAEIHAQV